MSLTKKSEEELLEELKELKETSQEPEVRPELYNDVIQVIRKGFLTKAAKIGDTRFVFKSLNHHEIENIYLLTGFEYGKEIPPNFWGVFLSHMVLFVGTTNVLVDREKHIKRLSKLFDAIPINARQHLIRMLSELNRKYSETTMMVEAYALEKYSRWYWQQVSQLDLTSVAHTGIRGTENLGLNRTQMIWTVLNKYEDIRFNQEVSWEHAKFIGGCFVGKGMKEIHTKDAQRKRAEKDENLRRKNTILQHLINGIPIEESKKEHVTGKLIVANTVEELAEQVAKSLKGEKDWHDDVIERFSQRHQENQRQEEELRAEIERKAYENFGDANIVGSTLLGATDEEIRERLKKQKQREYNQNIDILENPKEDVIKMENIKQKYGLSGTWKSKLWRTKKSLVLK